MKSLTASFKNKSQLSVAWWWWWIYKPTHVIRRRQWHPTPVLLPGKSHGRRNLVGCSPRGREESDTTEQLPFHFSLSCIGEGNGNPLQCSCLENPRDGGAWWAAVCGVAQSRTRLKRLSSSSTRVIKVHRTNYAHTQTHTCKTGEIWIRLVDCINVNFLTMILL